MSDGPAPVRAVCQCPVRCWPKQGMPERGKRPGGTTEVPVGFEGEAWQVRSDGDPVGEILIEEADFP